MPFRAIINNFVPGFLQAMLEYWESVFFVQTHRLWKGFLSYGWLIWILLVGGLLVSYKFLKLFISWVNQVAHGETEGVLSSASMLFNSVTTEGYELFYIGGMKYIILILTEVLVFHISRRTLEVLTGDEQDVRFQTFIQAQIRMIKVVIRSWIKEIIAMAIIGVVTGFLDLDWLNTFLVFLIQCYYLGFAVMDNYNERYELTIKQSIKRIEPHAGAAVGIGLVFYALLLIPVAGAIIAPSMAGVAATLLMHEYELLGKFEPLEVQTETTVPPSEREAEL